MVERKNSGPVSGEASRKQARSRMLRFVVCFLLCLVLGFGLLESSFAQPAMDWGTANLVKLCAGMVRLFGGHAAAQADTLVNLASGFSIEVKNPCNASNVTLLLWAAILSFPAAWIQKLKGLAVGTIVIHALNLVRVISLFYLGQYSAGWFDFAHLYVWESVLMVATMAIFGVWVQRSLRAPSRAIAAGE